MKLGDPLNGYAAIGKASTIADAAGWLKDRACQQYPDSEFARNMAASSDLWLSAIYSSVEVIAAPFITCGQPDLARYEQRAAKFAERLPGF